MSRVYTMVLNKKILFRILISAALALLLGWLIFGSPLLAHADAILTIEPITWNVVGLDSNNVNVGPNNFPVGVRVCNSGDAPATTVVADFVWDTSDSYIALRSGSKDPITISSIAAGTCSDFYFEVEITRDANAYDHTREYHIEVSSTETSTISTPTPREIYVEHLISQSRNSTTDVLLDTVSIAPGGTMTLVLGETYDIELVGSTATNGYEQIESYINFPNTIFQINSVTSTYTANGGTDPDAASKVYADGCGWENDPNSPNYRSCLSTGKYGGDITVNYNVTIIGGAGTSEILNTLIYDFSGSSYHYNSDFSVAGRIAAIVDPSLVTIDKNFAPDPTNAGGVSTLTFTLTNPNGVAINGASFSDIFPTSPGAMTVADPATYSTSGCGTPTFTPVAGATSLSFSDGIIPANGICTASVQVTPLVTGAYDNTSSNLLIDTVDTGNSASDSLTVNNAPVPPPCTPGMELARWTMDASQGTGVPPLYSWKAGNADTAIASFTGGTNAIHTSYGNPVNSWSGTGWYADRTGPPLFPSATTAPYFEFVLDTSNFTDVSINFDYGLMAQGDWGPNADNYVFAYSQADSGAFSTILDINATKGNLHNSGTISATATGSSTTTFRINAVGASKPAALVYIDNVIFTGCAVPAPPTITKAFATDPIAVGSTSILTFTLSNQSSVAATGVAFSDTLPTGLTVATTGPTVTCGGTLSTTAPNIISFGGGTLAAKGSCTTTGIAITATTSGPHTNISGFISSTEGGTNTGPDGSAIDTLTALVPPEISKQFSPNPILINGTSTLSFAITNPNPDNQLTNVAFLDTYPVEIVNATPANASTTCTGGIVTAADGGAIVSLSGATIAGGGSCSVQVDVTSATLGSHLNTSGNVSADIVGNGNTASDTLVVEPVRPSISLLKQVSATGAAPWTTFVGVNIGDSVWYQFTVENTGDVALTTVSVTDPTLSGLGVDLSGCTWANLALYETQTCVVGPVTAVIGSNSNTATAHGTYSGTVYTDTSTATYATTGLTLVKTATESTFTAAGDVLHYSYLVTNSGFAPLAGPVTIDDDMATDESCPDVDTVGDFDTFLDPVESITCTATYTVTAGDVLAKFVTNTADASVDGVTSNTDSETVTLLAPPTITKVFLTPTIDVGGTSLLIITLNNPGGTDLTGLTFTDTYPIEIFNATPANPNTTCQNGIVVAADGGGSVVLSGVTLPAETACNVSVTVSSITPGSHVNTIPIGGVTTNEGVSNNAAATDTLNVNAAAPTVSKAFNPDTIGVGGTSTLTITLGNTNATAATLTSALVDTLPANVFVENPANISGTCTGTVTAVAGGSTITYANGSTIPSGGCTIDVDVTSSTVGIHTNTIAVGDLQTDFGNNAAPASDDLTVTILAPTVTKVFSPDTIPSGGTSTITITIVNPNTGTGLTGVGFSDTYPAGVVNETPPGTTNNCGGTVTAVAGGGSLSLSGGSIGADASCQVTVDVTSSTPGTHTNTTSVVASNDAPDSGTATDDLTVTSAAPTVSKVFSPDTIGVGGTSTLTITLGNTNATAATLTSALVDTLPANVFVENPANIGGTCTGTVTAVAGGSTITYANGSTIPSGGCTIDADVTSSTVGTHTNTIATGDLQTDFGNNAAPASDDLTVLAGAPEITLTKTGTLNDDDGTPGVSEGDTISYAFTVVNSGNVTLTNITLADTVGGVTISGGPIASLGVGASDNSTFTGSYTITQTDIDGGSFANTATVTGTPPSGPDVTDPDSETVVLAGAPEITLTKTGTLNDDDGTPGVSEGDTISYAFTVVNSGNVTLTNITLADTVGGVTISGGPIASLGVGASDNSTFTGSYTITQTDIDGGSFANTATVTGTPPSGPDVTDPDSETVVLAGAPEITLTKTGTLNDDDGTPGVSEGDTISYAFTVVNSGNVTLTNITLADTVGGVTISGGPIASLGVGASDNSTFTGSYTITQTDIDGGSFANTATVTGTPPSGPDVTDPDSETVVLAGAPEITLTKTITSGDPYSSVGDVLNYSFQVTNTGNVTLDGLFTVADDRATDESCPPTATLAPGASITCTASYTVTQTDLDNGSVTNTATASGLFGGNPVISAPDSETANSAVPIVIDPGVTKSGDPLTAQVGDTVTFTLFVFNTGNADADNVIVIDIIPSFLDIIPPVVMSPLGPGVTIAGNTITMDFGTVEPSESWTVTITTVVNALGVPPGDSNVVTLTTDSPDNDTDNNDDSVFITITPPTGGGDGPLLPGTGFAPDRVTALPQMPTGYAYLSYGELRLEIPKLDVDTSIVGVPRDGDGWDVTWLWDKAGYLDGTAFPTWSGNSVITGHVFLANGLEGPFADLKDLEYGDAVIVHGWGEQYVYEIREVDVVSPYDPSVLRHEEYPWLTLVTCAGYDETSDSYRWRVVARAVMMSIDSEAGSWTSSSSPEQHDIQTFDRVGSGGVQP